MTAGSKGGRTWSGTRRTRTILAALVVGVIVAAVVILLVRPSGRGPTPEPPPAAPDGIGVAIIVETVVPESKTATARVVTMTGKDLSEPVILGSTIPALAELKIDPTNLVQEQSIELPLASGDVSDYPFDRYDDQWTLLAIAETADANGEAREVPLNVSVIMNAAGYSGTSSVRAGADGQDVSLTVERNDADVAWAVIMMLINWALAAAAIGVGLAVMFGEREWESRHLAWLTAGVFALTAFRSNAPGKPPLGTFFDFASFFWAEAIIALMLIALVVRYLFVDRTRLGL